MIFRFLDDVDLEKYQDILNLCSSHWSNDTHCDSGSLLNLDDLADLNKNDLDDVNKDKIWKERFQVFKSDHESNERFRKEISGLISHKVTEQAEIQLSQVKYIYGGKGSGTFDFTKDGDLVSWWKKSTVLIHGNKHIHQTEPHYLPACFDSKGRLDTVNGFIERSWHKGLMVINDNGNHRIGAIAAICAQNAGLQVPYIDKLISYQLNQQVLNNLLDKYSVYLAVQVNHADEPLFTEMDNICRERNAYCLKLSEDCTHYSLSKMHFAQYNVRLYFIEKSLSSLLLRFYLNKKLHNNDLIKKILRNKTANGELC